MTATDHDKFMRRFAEHKDRLVEILRAAHRGTEPFDEEGARQFLDVAAEVVLRWKREELSPKQLAARKQVKEARGRVRPLFMAWADTSKGSPLEQAEAYVALREELQRLIDQLDRVRAPRGRPVDRGRRIFAVNTLALLYYHITGQEAEGLAWSGTRGEHYADHGFPALLREFLEAIGYDGSTKGESLHKMILDARRLTPGLFKSEPHGWRARKAAGGC